MRTTVDVPDPLYRRIKARAALKGQSVKAFLLDALRDKLEMEKGQTKGKTGWRAAFGSARPGEVDEVQRIIDEEFSRVDPEDW